MRQHGRTGISAGLFAVAALSVCPLSLHASEPAAWGLLEKRCVKCHNSVDWAGGVAFDTMTPEDIPADAEIWETAVRKLRGRMMPPPGQPQPDQQTVDTFVA